MRGVSRPESLFLFGEGGKPGLPVLPRRPHSSREPDRDARLRHLPHRTSRPCDDHGGKREELRGMSRQSADCRAPRRAIRSTSSSFADGHPEFAVLRENQRDPSTIKLNHAIHMKPIRRGPTGPIVQLDCADCHRAAVVKTSWTYADANYLTPPSADSDRKANARTGGTLAPHNPSTGRELMAPVTFANACASCHLLSFDKRFSEGVPHDKPEVIDAFLKKKFREYAAAHPSELRVMRDPDRDLTGKPLAPRVQTLTARAMDCSTHLRRRAASVAQDLPAMPSAFLQRKDSPSQSAPLAMSQQADESLTADRRLQRHFFAGCRTQNSITKRTEVLPAPVVTRKH